MCNTLSSRLFAIAYRHDARLVNNCDRRFRFNPSLPRGWLLIPEYPNYGGDIIVKQTLHGIHYVIKFLKVHPEYWHRFCDIEQAMNDELVKEGK